MTTRSGLPYLWMLCGSVAFALMGGFAHALASSCDWQVIAIARSFIPLLVVTLIGLAGGIRFVFLRPGTLWLRSIAGSISMAGTFFALTRLPVADVFTLTNMFPIWVAILSWPLLNERPSGGVWLAVVSGVAGVVLIQQPHFIEGNFACLVALAASCFTAFAMIGLHRLRGIDVRAIIVHFSGVALIVCSGCFLVFDRSGPPPSALGTEAILLLLAVGVTATVGQVFLTKAFAAGSPARVSVVGLMQIVFALAIDVWWWHQSFDWTTLLGIALVVTPTAWVLIRRARAIPLRFAWSRTENKSVLPGQDGEEPRPEGIPGSQ